MDEIDLVCVVLANLPFVSVSPLIFTTTSMQHSCNLLNASLFVQFPPKSHVAWR
jgi:hypothetical protein